MTFHVGQKVVCVDAAFQEVFCSCQCWHEPGLNDVATVVNVYGSIMGVALELAEFPQHGCPHYQPGWLAESFRPIVSRKTDISIFKRMLTPTGVDA